MSPIGRKKSNNSGLAPPLWRRAGFTLTELILVVLIIAILVGISMPLFRRQFSDLELRNSCYNIAKLTSLAQQKAIGESKFFRINFDFEKRKYWLMASGDLGKFKRLKTRYGRIYSLPPGITIKGNQSSFLFYPNGRSQKIDLTVSSNRSGFSLKSKGGLGHVKVERIKIR